MGKYAQYFQYLLPITEFIEAVRLRTVSLVISDLHTRRLAGLKKGGVQKDFESDTYLMSLLLPKKFHNMQYTITI